MVSAGTPARGRTCLYIDMAYSLAELRQRRHLQFFDARHSGGYFDRVIGLHPLADRVSPLQTPIERKRFSNRQDVIEAKSTALGLPFIPAPVDLFLTQRRLLHHMSEVIRNEHVSLISATDPLYSGLFGLWLKRRTGVPLVIHLVANYKLIYEVTGVVAMPRMFPSRVLEKRVISHVLRNADLVAAGSETLRERAVADGAKQDRTDVFRVAKSMVSGHRIHPAQRAPLTKEERARLSLPESGKILLTVARLEKGKMVDDSIRAFSVVAKEHPDAVLLLAGEGAEREPLQKLAVEEGVADRVIFLGLLHQDLLVRLAPHCLVLSPLTGMALYETSMAGCPAIAYECDSSVADLVQTGLTGVLLKPRDWEGMGRAASQLLSDSSTRRGMSEAMRGRAEQLTDEAALYAHEHAAYDRVLGA